MSQLTIPFNYKGIEMEILLKCDFFVENILVVELKSLDKVLPIHEAQILAYMKLLKVPEGLMLNFNVTNIYNDGQKTYVNELCRQLPG
jgi:GxxExxY protein